MGTETIIVAVILLAILGGAVTYIIKAKKSGKKCIGCPDGCSCNTSKSKGCCCGMTQSDESQKQ